MLTSPAIAVYKLEPFLDDPRYRGFIAPPLFLDSIPQERSRSWQIKRLAQRWGCPKVAGRVRKFNDYPCVNLVYPAFSARAVEVLRELLEPNGELLPFSTGQGVYFAYNVTTVADVLDPNRSKVRWNRTAKQPTAIAVDRYEFVRKRVSSLTVFRLPITVSSVYVTQPFVTRTREHGLGGFNFQRVWPLPANVSWMQLARKQGEAEKAKGMSPRRAIKGNTLVLRLALSSNNPKVTTADLKAIDQILDQLDDILIDIDSETPALGNLEGHDLGIPGECRIFLSCPDADALVQTLRPWLRTVSWPRDLVVVKRFGNYTDLDSREVIVSL